MDNCRTSKMNLISANRRLGLLVGATLIAMYIARPAVAVDPHDLCRAATVRIRNGNSLGSGAVFRATTAHCYVLTNAHVAGTRLGGRVQCEFWQAGHQSRPVTGETVAVAYAPRAYRDIAVVRIDRRQLAGYLPPVVPLADERVETDYRQLFSVGCASGRWPTAFEGFGTKRNAAGGDTIRFVPTPAGGRSGSALFQIIDAVPRIVGLVAWRSTSEGGHGLDGRGENNGYGIAMTHHEVWAGLRGERPTTTVAAPEGAVPIGHAAAKPKDSPAGATERSILKERPATQPPTALQTGSKNDVILLYSDPVAIGPNTAPPTGLSDGCEDGRCLPPLQGAERPLFPSLPGADRDLPGDPPEGRDWLPWAVAAGALLLLAGRTLIGLPGKVADWFASRVEQRLQTHTQAPPQPTDKKA